MLNNWKKKRKKMLKLFEYSLLQAKNIYITTKLSCFIKNILVLFFSTAKVKY